MVPQRWKVPNSIVAVNRIEIIDHIDWLHNELAISMAWCLFILKSKTCCPGFLSNGGFEPLITSCWFFLQNPILLFFNLIYQCAKNKTKKKQKQKQKKHMVIFTPTNVLFENVSFFLEVTDEEKFLLFKYGEIHGKSAMLSYWYAWCKNAYSW